ncbi:sulfurtransferase [Pseudomonas sp. N040]|uniref:sulfurtransferase n=1 Tax=Pseudomonas sp. N040 TaxID=2785325 RepID=UPI0018A2C02A|nr:sulfurtransferase [Pseudomonas sp. N040]MBF7729448.1 sulfurtransferase [Pseudomonas sp. N040]MBW7013088.1 sulfurtransferase [Pseudomonas sp. N040]
MPIAQLLTPAQLAERLQDPRLVILDCRFALDDPAQGQRSYAAGHIPGARFADLERDFSGPVQPGISGRHPLPAVDRLLGTLRQWGVNNDSSIVLYDDGPGAFAARAWWLLAWLGKRSDVYLLDGGWQAWCAAGLPRSTAQPAPAAGQFEGAADAQLLVDAQGLVARLGSPHLTLLDARSLPRFRGDVEPIDPVAGHIPGARCAAFTDNLDAEGRFRSREELRQRFAGLLAGRSPASLVAYCGSGVTACHNLFALCLAGYDLAPLYAGSWSEWITDPQRPVATGD